MPPELSRWRQLVLEAAYHLRRGDQLERDEGEKGGPKDGWERDEYARLRQFIRDAFGLEG